MNSTGYETRLNVTKCHAYRGRMRMVANGCGRLRNVERTHPQPPDPQSETGTLATHSEKKLSETLDYNYIRVPVYLVGLGTLIS